MDAEQRSNRIRWGWLSRSMPAPVVRVLRTIEVLGLRVSVAHEIEQALFGWDDRRTSGRRVDQASARQTWARALRSSSNAVLLTTRHIVDDRKRQAHQLRLQTHETAASLRAEHQRPFPIQGVLTVRERQHREAYFGLRSYLEVTPVEIPVYVALLWQKRTGKIAPRVWDLTSGSGTVADVLVAAFAATVVASDLVEAVDGTNCADLFDAGEIAQRRTRRAAREGIPQDAVVEHPDLVFIDAPSRGTPTHAELYAGAWPEQDLATFERDAYLANILASVVLAAGRLAPGGLVSVVLREGVRRNQHVEADPLLIDDFLRAATEFALVLVERIRIEEPWPLKQASLGIARMPTSHLLFEATAR